MASEMNNNQNLPTVEETTAQVEETPVEQLPQEEVDAVFELANEYGMNTEGKTVQELFDEACDKLESMMSSESDSEEKKRSPFKKLRTATKKTLTKTGASTKKVVTGLRKKLHLFTADEKAAKAEYEACMRVASEAGFSTKDMTLESVYDAMCDYLEELVEEQRKREEALAEAQRKEAEAEQLREAAEEAARVAAEMEAAAAAARKSMDPLKRFSSDVEAFFKRTFSSSHAA